MRSESEIMQRFVGSAPEGDDNEFIREKLIMEVLLDIRSELKSLTDLARAASEAAEE